MDIEVCNPNFRFLIGRGYFCGIKISDSIRTSKDKFTLFVGKSGSFIDESYKVDGLPEMSRGRTWSSQAWKFFI